jgi:AraC-like DNA-binding protein
MMTYQMPFDWITRHMSGVVRQGLSFEKVTEASLIDRRHGDNRDLVRPAQFLLLCMNTALGIDDAAHGLARSRIDPAYTALGLRVALGCTTLEDAIRAVARLYRTASSAIQMELKTKQDLAILNIRAEPVRDADAIVLEDTYLSWIFMHCMYFLGSAMPVLSVWTRDPFHFNLGGRHFAIGATVRYGPVTSMQFPRILLGRRGVNRAGANPHWDCFRLWLDFIEHGDAAPARREYVTARGQLHLEDVATRAGLSASTMRRRLLIDGGFRHARREALVAAALRKLRSSDDSVESIAAELGYSDARSLRRFLKAATGATPQQIRSSGLTTHHDDTQVRRRLQAIGAAMGG